jgi:hypothetical protein
MTAALNGSKRPGGSWLFGRNWFVFVIAVVSMVIYVFFLGLESSEPPIQMDGVVDKNDVEGEIDDRDKPVHPAPSNIASNVVEPPSKPTPVTAPMVDDSPPTPIVELPSTRKPVSDPKVDESPPTLVLNTDLSEIDAIIENIRIARERMIEDLKKDYGAENYKNIFTKQVNGESISVGRLIFKSPSGDEALSWGRLRNKIIRKLLQVLVDSKKQDRDNDNPTAQQQLHARFVWATGGHSATAAHGNFYSESYTAVLERRVTNVFRAAGLGFIGRNYAMGGTDSAPETAWCIDAIFGAHDPDIIVWDHGYEYRVVGMHVCVCEGPLSPLCFRLVACIAV